MNDNKKMDIGLMIERAFYYALMAFIVALIVFSAVFFYTSVQSPEHRSPEIIQNEEGSVNIKPLPDFIVDKVPSNELESLKP